MRSIYLLVLMILAAIFAVFLGLRAASSTPSSTVTPIASPLTVRDTLVEGVEFRVEGTTLESSTPEAVALQVTPQPDGSSILESYCTRCHVAQWIKEIKKPRTEWDKILAKMEAMGVQLGDSEKVILLDYLASADQP